MRVAKVKPVVPMQRIQKDKPREFCGTVEGIDLRDPASIGAIIDIHHSVGRTHRSVSEAFKDADYANAIYKQKSDWFLAVEWFGELFMAFFWIGVGISMPVLFVLWLFK